MTRIAENVQKVRAQILAACQAAGRDPREVQLLAVSKTRTHEEVREAFGTGLRAFGENYVQEGIEKIQALQDLPLEWHFIGPLQSNKSRLVAEHFDWVHSLDRLKIAERLSAQRPEHLAPLNVCLQVNISHEASKSGCSEQEALDLARAIATLPRLRLRGLMVIPAPTQDAAAQQAILAQARQLFQQLKQHLPALDTLSMGMSDDLEAAVAEGSTLLRIGTALFGPRPSKP